MCCASCGHFFVIGPLCHLKRRSYRTLYQKHCSLMSSVFGSIYLCEELQLNNVKPKIRCTDEHLEGCMLIAREFKPVIEILLKQKRCLCLTNGRFC
jgi:hypothetical protein